MCIFRYHLSPAMIEEKSVAEFNFVDVPKKVVDSEENSSIAPLLKCHLVKLVLP